MVSRKRKFWTVLLIFLLAALIVGGVFGISYYKGGVTFPWEVTTGQSEDETSQVAQEPEEPVVQEKPKPTKPEPVVEQEPEEEKEDPREENLQMLTSGKLDYFGPLHVEDTKLVDKNGKPVRLVGISSHGINEFPQFVTAESLKYLRNNFGINLFRVAMYTSDYNGYCVAGDDNKKELKKVIDTAVNAATENDMYVIIDWHILFDNNPNEYKSEAIQFFGEMVRKYKGNEHVIYEICNEPNGDTTWEDIKQYANEVIPVIQNVDPAAVILVGTPSWSSDLHSVLADPLEFDNIMYTYHFYAGTHKATQREAFSDCAGELPVFVSEFGMVNADGNGGVNKPESKKWKELLEEYNISCAVWNLSNKDEGSALIKADCTKTTDFTLEDLSDEAIEYLTWISEAAE